MKENKNVVIVAWRDMWHPQKGGAEIYITKIAEKLRDSGYDVIFFTERYRNSKEDEIIDNIRYIRRGNALTLHLEFPKYFKKYLKENTDILIENFNAVPFYVPKLHDNTLTVIHHIQDLEWNKKFGKIIGTLLAKFFRNEVKRVYKEQKIVTVSPSSLEELLSIGFKKENIEVIYNGIDVPISSNIHKPTNKINIFSVGRVRNTKNIDEAIEMVKHSVKDIGIKNIRLDIAGKGDDEERLKALVKKYNLEEYVTFLGYIDDGKKVRLFKDAHLHVQFSRKEGWGITIIEAAATATPTICYRVPGLEDSVKSSTGYFVETTLQETWDKAVEDIQQQNEEYKSKQRECIKWADNFRWDNQMDRFLKYLESKN
jgi:glycosyltransferase involved in cell wall biosynthesis